MNSIPRRSLMFLIVFIAFLLVLFSYFFASSRADRITSNEEYIESLREASRGKRLAGTIEVQPVAITDQGIEQSDSRNILEELLFQIKAIFNVR